MIVALRFRHSNTVEIMNQNQNKCRIVEISGAQFESEVLTSDGPVLVWFWAPWSQPCQILKPVLDDVAAACAGTVKVVGINADDNPGLGMEFEIQSIPTLLYFIGGHQRARIVGTASKEAILNAMNSTHCSTGKPPVTL